MKCPALGHTVLIANDPKLAARLSCLLARPDTYVVVLDGPRMARPDRDQEISRRLNTAARTRAAETILAGLPGEAVQNLTDMAQGRVKSGLKVIDGWEDRQALSEPDLAEVMTWGRDRIGIGLLKALRRGCGIKFTDAASPAENLPTLSGHLVVCEMEEEMSQVVAANYAYAIGAGLQLLPSPDRDFAEAILERFYGVKEIRERAPSEALAEFRALIRERCAEISLDKVTSITFVGNGLPYGFAFSELPSTHLFDYPDLGIVVANGFATQQPWSRGLDVAALVDPHTVDASEMRGAEMLLASRGIFVRCYEGDNATVRNVTEMVELFPYDLVAFATHCGDVNGIRCTYDYQDKENIQRSLVVDMAIGVADTDDQDMLRVTQYMKYVSLDGVDWTDPKKDEKLYVGEALTTFTERTRPETADKLEPVKKEPIHRVVGSAALKMRDHNMLTLPRSIADEGHPIVINNACCSWHQLARTYSYCGARAYLGTLYSILTGEAEAVTSRILGDHFGDWLPEALWRSQAEAFGDARPYIMMGVYPQALFLKLHDVPTHLAKRMTGTLLSWEMHSKMTKTDSPKVKQAIQERIAYYQRELRMLKDKWFSLPDNH